MKPQSLDVLLQERKDLEKRIKELEHSSRVSAIAEVKKIISNFGLEPYDLFDEISIKVEPKYFDPDTGQYWSGRGKTPKWLVGKDRSLFEIKKT